MNMVKLSLAYMLFQLLPKKQHLFIIGYPIILRLYSNPSEIMKYALFHSNPSLLKTREVAIPTPSPLVDAPGLV